MDNDDTDFASPSDEGSADDRPLGFWLRTVDALITHELAAAFAGAGVDRRDWMLLNSLSGDAELPPFAERFARKGKRLRGLADRGWAEEQGDGTWALTAGGRAARDRLTELVDGIRSRVAAAVSPGDYATTMASLEAIARDLGWEEGRRMPRGRFGRGGGFGPGFRPDFGPGFGAGFGPGFGPDFGPGADHCHPHHTHSHHEHGHHEHGAHRHGGHHGHHDGSGRSTQRAYERGFDAGFARGRSADVA